MQFILFLLGLFAIGCVLYGISAGVQIIVHGFARLAGSASNNEVLQKEAIQVAQPTVNSKTTTEALPTSEQCCISELQILFGLYQNGGLTRDEFEKCKSHT